MPYFTTAELRTLPDVDNVTKFPDTRLVAAHDWIASIIRRECGTSFIVETVTGELVSGRGSTGLRLSDPYVRTVTGVTVDGVAWAPEAVATAVVEDGFLYQVSDAAWSSTARKNVAVTYTAGYSDAPPADLKEAAMRAARNWLLTSRHWSGVDTRATSISNEYGNTNLSVASADGRPTGIPDVDSTITKWARLVRVPRVS